MVGFGRWVEDHRGFAVSAGKKNQQIGNAKAPEKTRLRSRTKRQDRLSWVRLKPEQEAVALYLPIQKKLPRSGFVRHL